MGGKKPLRRPLWPPTRATASNYYPLGLDGAGGAAKPLLRAPKKPAPLHGRLPAFSGAVDAFERAWKCFLEWRYFFSIILSEFLKNRVALQEVNRNDISSELRKYVNDDIQLSAIIEYMGYDEGVLHEHEGNVFFVNESNWLIARLVNHMTGEIVQDDIILDSGSITDVLNSRDAFFDYIFGTENH